VTTIGTMAFDGCSSLTSIAIPESVYTISNSAFAGCSSLTSIAIPESVYNLGFSVFKDCSSLVSVTLPEGLDAIDAHTFAYCTKLAEITIPKSVKNIGDGAFEVCSSLTNITIPEGVSKIGERTFFHCSSLTSITIPESVTSIDQMAFLGCSSLISITIPDGVTSIDMGVFSKCSSLKSVIIPKSVTSIGEYAFEECNSLWHVFYEGTQEQWGKIEILSTNLVLTTVTKHYNCTDDKCISIQLLEQPTCTKSGLATHTCAVCGEAKTVPVSKTAEHTYNAWTKTDTLLHKHTCTACGREETKFHNWDEGKVTKTPCDEEGIKTHTCTSCDAKKDVAVPVKGHTFGDWTVLIAPTTEAPGLEERVCTGCGDKEQHVLLKLDPVPTESAPASDDPSDGKTPKDNTVMIVLIAVTAVAVCGAAVMIPRKKK